MNSFLLKTPIPGIAEMNALAEDLRSKGERPLNLGQAIPFFSPPKSALARLGDMFNETECHRYCADAGLITLRRKIAKIWDQKFQHKVNPEKEMLITGGANGAYLMTVMTLLNPGDKMGLLTPWYFNHAMAVSMIGGTVVEMPLSSEDGFQLAPEKILAFAVKEKVKALTIVSPNNPTGTTYLPAALRKLSEGLREKGIYLIVDETYAFFPDQMGEHFSPGSLEEKPERIITLGTFSKTFAMTGWRVGYVFASESLIKEMLKVQDTMIICASRPGQILAYSCFEIDPWIWIQEQGQILDTRQTLLLEQNLGEWRVCSSGKFFAFLKGPRRSRDLALELLRKEKVIVIPGDIFGSNLADTFRVSIGSPTEPEFLAGITRLASFLQKM